MVLNLIDTKNGKKFSQRELLIGFAAILAVLVGLIFPQKVFGESFWLSFFLFTAFPIAIVLFLLKEPLANFGISLGNKRSGLIFSAIIIAILILANYFLVFHSKYVGQIPIARGIANSFLLFLLFEIFIALPLHFFWEFFFRGFVQLGLEKKMGGYSLVLAAALQATPFLRGNWIVALLILSSSLGAGLIVRQSRSVLYSAISLWLISVSLDIMIIRLVHQITG
jgi:membrane protease YdiL (CAAX protease family)